MKVLIKVEIDESRQWAEANKLYDLLKNYKPVLMPMPQPRYAKAQDDDVKWGECIGWNACIEEIEK